MIVGELIKLLQAFDPNLKVVVSGFDESGYDDIEDPKIVKIVQDRLSVWHCGMYVSAPSDRAIGEPFDAVHIDF